jgi:small-conductance mechanosensitive channel
VPGAEIERIERSLPAVSAELARTRTYTLGLIAEQPSLEALQAQDESWQRRQHQLGVWLADVTRRATGLQGDMDRLGEQRTLWTLTLEKAAAEGAPEPLLGQIDRTLAAIAAAEPLTRAERDRTLDLQARIAQEVGHSETLRSRIGQIQQTIVGGLLVRDGRPLWSHEPWAQAQGVVMVRLSQIGATLWADLRLYLSDPSKRLPVHLGIFILALSALLAGRRQVDRWAEQGQSVSRLAPVFDRPAAAALLVALMVATNLTAPVPFAVKELLGALMLAPMVLLARPVVNPKLVPALYALGILFALDTLRRAFGGVPPLIGQSIILVQALVGVALLVPLFRGGSDREGGPGKGALRRLLVWLILAVLAVGLVASLLGYLRLAPLTAPAVLFGAADALGLYAAVEVAMAVVAYAFRSWPLRGLHMIEHHRERIEGRIYRLLVVLAVLGWWARYLSYLGLLEPSLARVGELLAIRFEMGSFGISAGAVLAFLATLVVAFILSSLIRFVLAEELYPRAGIPTGISYAVSSVIHYAIVALAFFLALGFLGVTLTQVTVLAGALGVGIGFGLQSIVNNFVSGLILLFERPIHVGDAVQVGSLQGWVRRIGIRASVVRTFQGAEIIVPNAQLTTEQVTNWTLSDQQRRIDLPVGLSYGVEPGRVIALLEEVARANPRVLKSPPPQCLFTSYGDSSVNFELRAWTDYAVWMQVQSELTVAVYNAVYAAGMSFPFPQREVRLLSDPAPDPEVPGSATGKASPD